VLAALNIIINIMNILCCFFPSDFYDRAAAIHKFEFVCVHSEYSKTSIMYNAKYTSIVVDRILYWIEYTYIDMANFIRMTKTKLDIVYFFVKFNLSFKDSAFSLILCQMFKKKVAICKQKCKNSSKFWIFIRQKQCTSSKKLCT